MVYCIGRIPVEDGDVQRRSPATPQRLKLWSERRYLIIDEISMIDCKTFKRLNTELVKLKSNKDELFGGVNIIVLGDFLQFPSVNTLDLYLGP